MNNELILIKLNEIFKKIFEDENLIITEKSNSSDVDGWDSLSHILLIIEIENIFNFKMMANQIQKTDTVKDLIEIILENI